MYPYPMPSSRFPSPLEKQLAALDALAAADSDQLRRELQKALHATSNILTVKAARIIGDLQLKTLVPDLETAFKRCLGNPLKTDKGCMAKIAIIETLNQLDHHNEEIFLLGIRHVQKEPAFGPPVDTAENLRGKCAFGLVRIGSPRALPELAQFLHDPEPAARLAAVRATGGTGGETAEIMLRMKVLSGDPETEITRECLSVLMEIAPENSLEFVAKHLDSADTWLANQTALILGESRHPKAWEILRAKWDNACTTTERGKLLLPLALFRSDEAFQLLLETLEESHESLAIASMEPFKIITDTALRRQRLIGALHQRNDEKITRAFKKLTAQWEN